MKARCATLHRKTKETDIRARICLDGRGRYKISTGVRFLDHMLELFTRHGGFDLELMARGDLDVDQHHTVEDTGIVLGEVVKQALGKKRGINRAGYFIMPMDETLAVAALDLSGRAYLVLNAPIKASRVGDFQTELLEDFFQGFAVSAALAIEALRRWRQVPAFGDEHADRAGTVERQGRKADAHGDTPAGLMAGSASPM